MIERSIEFVYDRFEELRLLLEYWGWDVIERGDLSEWDEGRRTDPVMGLVRIRGHRESMPGVRFTVKEWWGWPPLEGPEQRQGCVLAGYHYTAVSQVIVRHCYDPSRHPDMPFHVHHGEADPPRSCNPITSETALQQFELRLAEELIASAGIDVIAELDDDDVDGVFGEGEAA
jgi:hypothetical protein